MTDTVDKASSGASSRLPRRRMRSVQVNLYGLGTISLIATAVSGCSSNSGSGSGTFQRNHYKSTEACIGDYNASGCLSGSVGPIYFKPLFQTGHCRGYTAGPGQFWSRHGFDRPNPDLVRAEKIERGVFGPRCGRASSRSYGTSSFSRSRSGTFSSSNSSNRSTTSRGFGSRSSGS